MRALGFLLCALGAALLLPQLVTEFPWQFGVVLSLGMIVAGGLMLVENPVSRRGRASRRRNRRRKGYLVGGRN